MASGDYAKAQGIFEVLGSYSDSATKAAECVYERAEILFADEDYESARALYASINYLDSADKTKLSQYREAEALYTAGNYADAETLFASLAGYNDSADRTKDSRLQQGIIHMQEGKYADALTLLETVDYGDSATLAAQCHCELGRAALASGDMDTAMAQYALATELPEAQEALMSAAKDYVAINETEKAIQMLWLIRGSAGAQNMLKEIGDQLTQSGDTTLALLAYIAMEKSDLPEMTTLSFSVEQFNQLNLVLNACDLLPEELRFADFERYAWASLALEQANYDVALPAFSAAGNYKDAEKMLRMCWYENGVELFSKEEYDSALAAFSAAGDYGDAKLMEKEVTYQKGLALYSASDYDAALEVFQTIQDYNDVPERIRIKNMVDHAHSIATGTGTIALKTDGTVLETAYSGKRKDWSGIVSISGGAGLKADGSVISVDNEDNVDNWTEIVSIETGGGHIVGVKADGTVVITGENDYGECNIRGWKDIVAVAVGNQHTVGLKKDGTVVAVGYNGYYQCDVSSWTNIVAVAAGQGQTVGLKADGTVIAIGNNEYGQCNVGKWSNIVAIAAGMYHTVGLKADGTVVATGMNKDGQCDVGNWRNIKEIVAGYSHTVGLKADGTVVAVGDNWKSQCDVSKWTGIGHPEPNTILGEDFESVGLEG